MSFIRVWFVLGAGISCAAPPPAAPASAGPTTTASSPPGVAEADAAPSSNEAQVAPGMRVDAFFREYRDGTDFEFLRRYCSSRLERFVTLKNVDVERVIQSARAFFRDKRKVSYVPSLDRMQIQKDGETTSIKLALTMSWGRLVPADWAGDTWVGVDRNRDLIESRAVVDVELSFDGDSMITSYVEKARPRAKYRVTGARECGKGGKTTAYETPSLGGSGFDDLAAGTLVTDLGETFATELTAKGRTSARKILHDGTTLWMTEDAVFTTYGFKCLELVE